MSEPIHEYAHDLVQRVTSDSEASGISTHDAFAEIVLQELETAGHIEDPLVAYYRSHGVEISGYALNEVQNTLDLFLVEFAEAASSLTVTTAQLTTRGKRALGYLTKVRKGLRGQITEAVEAHDMASAVEARLAEDLESIRVFLITNNSAAAKSLPDTVDESGVPVSFEIWDIKRLFRLESSGVLHEPIAVDFDPPLACLTTPATNENYSVLLAIVPGRRLAEIYSTFGSRLLQLNVRSFLQLRGGVNKGIRETLLHSPERFLAYNNGISATASAVQLQSLDGGRAALLTRVTDFQVVNGGQTTASLHSALMRDGADLDDVYVQMKLTVVEQEHIDEIVPEISKFSNTQNKVTVVDFSSNHPFHVELEKASRSLYAPALPGTGQETRWFFERARGQYEDALMKERTPARKKAFKLIQPVRQKFTKTDVAKWENSWDQRPWLVARGAEKNFRAYMSELGQSAPTKDLDFVKRLIAKGILFKATEKVVTDQQFGGYRANIVTYTVAKLANATAQRVDLDQIWQEQQLSPALERALEEICLLVQPEVMNPRGTTNIGEWTKREGLWAIVQQIPWEPSTALKAELSTPGQSRRRKAEDQVAGASATEVGNVARASSLTAEGWFALSAWARETDNLEGWQRRIAYSIGRRLAGGQDPTVKQAAQGVKIMDEAERLGFKANAD